MTRESGPAIVTVAGKQIDVSSNTTELVFDDWLDASVVQQTLEFALITLSELIDDPEVSGTEKSFYRWLSNTSQMYSTRLQLALDARSEYWEN